MNSGANGARTKRACTNGSGEEHISTSCLLDLRLVAVGQMPQCLFHRRCSAAILSGVNHHPDLMRVAPAISPPRV